MDLFYRQYGSGVPLLILHGLYGSSDNWATFARKIGDLCTVILPDLRNHGRSPSSEIHDYSSMSDDIFELSEKLSLNRFFIAGHSMGAKVAVKFALRHPGKIKGLIAGDVSPFHKNTDLSIYHEHDTILEAIINLNIKHLKTRDQAELMLSDTIRSPKVRALILKNLEREGDGSFRWRINAGALASSLDIILYRLEVDDSEMAEAKWLPALFLRGAHSGYLPVSHFEEIRKVFRLAGFQTVPDAGHWLQADNQAFVEAAFRDFISGNRWEGG